MPTQAPQKVVHLNRYYHFTQLMRDPAVEGRLLRYQSAFDGTAQTALVLRPAGRRPDKLFFFFHGMDGDSGDAVIVRDLVKRLDAVVVSMGGRGPAWVSDALLADAEQVTRTFLEGHQGFYLIGVSMGGTQALSLAGLLPDDLRRAVLGVIGLIPGADLPAILAASSNERVRRTLWDSVGGDMAALRRRSPARVLETYRSDLPFVIFYNRDDTILLAGESEAFVARLRLRRHPVAVFSAPGDHDFTYENFDYREAFGRLGSDSTEQAAPLLTDAQ